MAQPKSDPVYLLVTDLAASNPRNWKIPSISSSKVKLSLYHFALFKHWAVQIRDHCYEVNSRPSTTGSKMREFYLNNSCSFSKWEETVNAKKLSWERVEVGATIASDQEIHEQADLIWRDRFVMKYKLDRQNCQNFSYLLYKRIALEPEKIKEDMRRSWKTMPRRFSDVTHFLKSTVTSSIARGIVFELITDALILGAEVIGLEGAIGLEVLGLEVAGVALLGPIGEVIFAITIIAIILKKSKDKKWLKKLKKLNKKDKSALESGNVEKQSQQALNEQAELVLQELTEQAKSQVADGVPQNLTNQLEYATAEEQEATDPEIIELGFRKQVNDDQRDLDQPNGSHEVHQAKAGIVDLSEPSVTSLPPPAYALIAERDDEQRPPLPPRRKIT